MENIKFVKEIMGNKNDFYDFGNCRYYPLANGNTGKVMVTGGEVWGETYGVTCEIINEKKGKIDSCYFPFFNYFAPTQCSKNAPMWYQHIVRGKWYFAQYTHVLPTEKDFNNIRNAIFQYFKLFS